VSRKVAALIQDVLAEENLVQGEPQCFYGNRLAEFLNDSPLEWRRHITVPTLLIKTKNFKRLKAILKSGTEFTAYPSAVRRRIVQTIKCAFRITGTTKPAPVKMCMGCATKFVPNTNLRRQAACYVRSHHTNV
jgi:hypothetical protein